MYFYNLKTLSTHSSAWLCYPRYQVCETFSSQTLPNIILMEHFLIARKLFYALNIDRRIFQSGTRKWTLFFYLESNYC